jgi:succinylglutamic semialdehyde dehydrogenase
VVWDVRDADAAAVVIIQSAYITAGQRCSCARRLILPLDQAGDIILDRLVPMIRDVHPGDYRRRPEPYLGPVISEDAADRLMAAKLELASRGGIELVEMRPLEDAPRSMLRPGLIEVTGVSERSDAELFGPLLQVIRVPDFEAALREANNTSYGLVAGLLSDNRTHYEQFYRRTRAGVINWNRPTTGASGRLPFGGVGLSGNHRPSGYYAVDYCSYPVASLEIQTLSMPQQPVSGLQLPPKMPRSQSSAGE